MITDKTNILYARTKDHALIENGSIKMIGYIALCKRYLSDGTCIPQHKVTFNFGNPKIEDVFFWEDNLVFSSISIHTDTFLTDVYQTLFQNKDISLDSFISMFTEIYVIHELGF